MELAFTILLFIAMVATAIAIAMIRTLFAVVMLSGAFSLLAALLFIVMDAVDVAFTEAAVGAGISTVLMLGTIALTARTQKEPEHHSLVPLAIVLLTGGVLIYGTLDMPNFGSPDAPAQRHVGAEYIVKTPTDIDVPNIVTAVLASYRGYDTLGEVVVVFTAGISVVLLLSGLGSRRRQDAASTDDSAADGETISDHHLILRVITRMLIGPILLYGLYVQFHGDYGPGGGFQAGVIFAVGFILYGIVFRLRDLRTMVPDWFVHRLVAFGVLVYAGTGVVSIVLGVNFLDYNVLGDTPIHGQHWGILAIEAGVGITVFSVMLSIYYAFAGRPPSIDDKDW